MPTDDETPQPIALALIELANAIMQHKVPAPTSVDLWHQNMLSATDLIVQAGRFGLPLKVCKHHAYCELKPIGGVRLSYYFLSTDMSDAARVAYEKYNSFVISKVACTGEDDCLVHPFS